MDVSGIENFCKKYPNSLGAAVKYGTAGFRGKADDMGFIFYRMGILSVMRAQVKKAGIGVMITASHNPEEDNGIKISDPHGEMLEASWETYCNQIVNASNANLMSSISSIMSEVGLTPDLFKNSATVMVARDTRKSSLSLSRAVMDGIEVMNGACKDYGLLTTPQLHFLTCEYNTNGKQFSEEEKYFSSFGEAFNSLSEEIQTSGNYVKNVVVDCANGIGAQALKKMQSFLNESLCFEIINDGSVGILNKDCGADFVKTNQKAPKDTSGEKPIKSNLRYASFDGDADRIVYFYLDQHDKFHLLDGDKIATLITGYLTQQLSLSNLHLSLGLVQTAYANGSSTSYIQDVMKVQVAFAKTGVKYLHHKALQYDIGIYFEANGHGTVLFSKKAKNTITKACSDANLTEEERSAATKLSLLSKLINQTVGDAISDLLAVETILHYRGWSVEEWDSQYQDLPFCLMKVKVKDRNVIKTTEIETETTQPPGLQDAINEVVSKYPNGRSFARPSGTEDVVRVYAEAKTRENANELATKVACLVYDLAGGTGERPN